MQSQSQASLIKGVRIFYPFRQDIVRPSVLLSTGTSQNTQTELESESDIPYQAHAYLPNLDSRPLTLEESSALFVADPDPTLFKEYRSSSVGVIRIPQDLLAPLIEILDDLELRSDTMRKFEALDFNRVLDHPDYGIANQMVLDYIQAYSFQSHRPKLIGLHFQPPGLRTVTVGFDHSVMPPLRCRVGLHIDNWDQLPLLQKHQSRNRICINLGCEDRVFLFVNLPLNSVVRSLEPFGYNELVQQEQWIELGKAFMRHYPTYPVVRLRVASGEAYIASTDNLIHDASSLGKSYPDITWTALGYFGWTSLPRMEQQATGVSHAHS